MMVDIILLENNIDPSSVYLEGMKKSWSEMPAHL